MSHVAVRAALEGALNGITPAISTAWENAPFTPVSGTAYQKVNLLLADPDNLGFGSGPYREQGYLQVSLMYPLATGPAAAGARAELIRSTFYRGLSLINNGITVLIEKTPTIGSGTVDGDRWMIPVKIRFFANIA